jgi:hypothetical protein
MTWQNDEVKERNEGKIFREERSVQEESNDNNKRLAEFIEEQQSQQGD